MPSFYDDLQTKAGQMLTTYGQAAVFTRTAGRTFNPTTATYTGGTITTVTGKGVITEYSNREIDGEIVQRGDLKLVFEAGEGAPMIGDNCLVDGASYRTIDVKTVSPGGTVVIYKVQLRV